MTDRKPTPAQMEALLFVAEHGVSFRPSDYYRIRHRVDVRRDVWERCHYYGWLERDSYGGPSRLTASGRKVVDA